MITEVSTHHCDMKNKIKIFPAFELVSKNFVENKFTILFNIFGMLNLILFSFQACEGYEGHCEVLIHYLKFNRGEASEKFE